MGIKSTARGPCMVNVAWEEQANGPEGAYCRVPTADTSDSGVQETWRVGRSSSQKLKMTIPRGNRRSTLLACCAGRTRRLITSLSYIMYGIRKTYIRPY